MRNQLIPRLQKVIYCLLFILLLTSCASTNKSIEQKWLPFIEDGKTTKDEVILKLGESTGQFEDGRIFTYRMSFERIYPAQEKLGERVPRVDIAREGMDWEVVFRVDHHKTFQYSLVLVFDDSNILQKHRLLIHVH
jgi:hypothetical protein